MDDEVRLLLLQPRDQRLPVAVEVRLDRAHMGVGDLNDPHGTLLHCRWRCIPLGLLPQSPCQWQGATFKDGAESVWVATFMRLV